MTMPPPQQRGGQAEALQVIANWPITDPKNMDAVNMASVAREALVTLPTAMSWIDSEGVHHSMSFDAARDLIKEFFEQWPGGLGEVEASVDGWRRKALASAPPAPSSSLDAVIAEVEVEDERAELRRQQSESVMPMMGPLLDAWEGLDNDTRSIIQEDSPALARVLSAINRAMEGGEPVPYEQLPTASKARMLIEELDSESERLTRFTNDSRDGLLSAAARMIETLLAPASAQEAQPAPSVPTDLLDQFEPGGAEEVLRTYLKLHEGRFFAHWLWCAVQQIAAGHGEAEVMSGFGYAPSVGGWMPIESAPKDGTWLQLWRAPWQEVGRLTPLVFARWSAEDASFVWPDGPYDPFTEYGMERAEEDIKGGDYFDSTEFLFWAPLPQPPKEKP